MERPHIPVLLNEVIDGLALKDGSTVVDCTVGFGGHSAAIGEAIGDRGTILCLDADSRALRSAEIYLKDFPGRKIFVQANFREIAEIAAEYEIGEVDAVLMDLGLNSAQLDEPGRGFSFRRDEPLVMTLSNAPGDRLTAADLVAELEVDQLADIIYAYGEERFAKRIAEALISARELAPIMTTAQLVSIVEKSVPAWYRNRKINPATKTFQALRIAVNDELEALSEGLAGAWEILAGSGRLAVISFHSLEARIVKKFLSDKKREGVGNIITKHAVKPLREEVLSNPRSRSAELRIIEKI